jgi:hypothetical protein
MKTILISTILALCITNGLAQSFDLPNAIKGNKLTLNGKAKVSVSDEAKRAITVDGVVWLTDMSFSEGTIEVSLRGNDIMQGTFLGIAFHAVDTITYDGVYFRPFNFQSADPVRKIHAVQYMSLPEYPWPVTREKMNGVYEKAVTPAPGPNDWFQAKVVVKGKQVSVYVNGSETPSLVVTKLNDRKTGKIGIWNTGKPVEFANLVITKQ